jgi:hypothetical protein
LVEPQLARVGWYRPVPPLVDPAWDPIELLRLILSLATYWASASGPPSELSRYRDTVEEAVRRLVAPPR